MKNNNIIEKHLIINGGSVATIKYNTATKKARFYTFAEVNGWDILERVDKKAFIDYLVKLAAVCLTTWSDALFSDYIRLLEVARYTEEEAEEVKE